MLFFQKHHRVGVLFVPGMVANIADTNRISSDYPFFAEVLSAPDFVSKLDASLTLKFCYNSDRTLLFRDTVEP